MSKSRPSDSRESTMAAQIEGLIGRKVGMTQLFREDGAVVPVTVLKAGPCVVVGRRTREKDGYEAVQLGLVESSSKSKMTKPRRGLFDKHSLAPLRTLREVKFAEAGRGAKADKGEQGDAAAEQAEVKIGDQVM